jgi:SAM-dependent methyltransferase
MTEAQLDVARRHLDYHRQRFGYAAPNVVFHHGYIEDLDSVGIEPGSVDVIVSNCVVNLSPDKRRVFAQAFRALKPGGELYYSDVFASRRVPEALQRDPVLLGECLGGALYTEDFRRLLGEVGCADFRVVAKAPITLTDPGVFAKAGMIGFQSMTVRAFKLPFEDRCEDYGQVATYLGSLPESPHAFALDDHHLFHAGKPMLVCGNTAEMLAATRYAPHFRVTGDRSVHYGLFDCAPAAIAGPGAAGGACC